MAGKVYDVEIFQNGSLINTIVADEDFAKVYCESNGYTYSIRNEAKKPFVPIDVPLEQKIKSMEERNEFLEDVLASAIQFIYAEAEAGAKTKEDLELTGDALAELAQQVYS